MDLTDINAIITIKEDCVVPLYVYAIHMNCPDVAIKLIEQGADINVKIRSITSDYVLYPPMLYIWLKNRKIAEYIFEHKDFNPNATCIGIDGSIMPMIIVVACDELRNKLYKKGANINSACWLPQKNNDICLGCCPIYLAIPEQFDWFLNNTNCDINGFYLRSIDGYSIPALLKCSEIKHMIILIKKGIDPCQQVVTPLGVKLSPITFLLTDIYSDYTLDERINRAKLLYNYGVKLVDNEYSILFNNKRTPLQSPTYQQLHNSKDQKTCNLKDMAHLDDESSFCKSKKLNLGLSSESDPSDRNSQTN